MSAARLVTLVALLLASSCGPGAPVTPSVNQPPVPVLVVQASARVGESVTVDGNGSVDLDGSVRDVFILFGDGSDPFVGFTTVHAWSAPGLYLVELYPSRARARITVTP